MTNDDRAAATPPEAVKGPDSVKGNAAKRRRSDAARAANEPQIGHALRSVYDQTVSEAIPDDLLALLGRLD